MIKQIKFKNKNLLLAGNLHLPVGFDEAKKYPAIVIAHPAGGVKEQTTGLYASKLAAFGYIALAYDASHQGESEGLPRFVEEPALRVEDIRCAVDYFTTLPYVDKERIGAMGVCAGASYALNAAQTEHRIKAYAGISTTDMGTFFRVGIDGSVQLPQQLETLKTVAAHRTAVANGAEPAYAPYVPPSTEGLTDVDLIEAHNYYYKENPHPNSQNKMLLSSMDKIMAFTAADLVSTYLTQPMLLIAGSKAGTMWLSEGIYKAATCKKELHVIEGATHMSLYGNPAHVNEAVEKLKAFFGKNL